MKKFIFILLCFATTYFGFSQSSKKYTFAEAEKLAKEIIILDAHLDFPLRVKAKKFTTSKEIADYSYDSKEGDFDFVRAKKGGMDAAFMAVYLPPAIQGLGY
nr:membrane dipeptidase [Saprospiraceae bacterium]